ncbi:MAG: hypothetical protein N2F24_13895, partial [Deltaproteobacteria bacterium]
MLKYAYLINLSSSALWLSHERFKKKQAMTKIPEILAGLIELPEKDVFVVSQESNAGLDFLVKAAGYHFQVACKSSSSRAPLLMALRQITESKNSFDDDD